LEPEGSVEKDAHLWFLLNFAENWFV
jgi:hypothetical protein